MVESIRRSKLHVEGKDDKNAIIHLLVRHGIDYDAKDWPATFPSIEAIGSNEELLAGAETAVRLSNNLSIGFVLDANSSLQDRWTAIKARLERVYMDVPNTIPAGGFVGNAKESRARVGVWLMPDNQRNGTLEEFLLTLIGKIDKLLSLAERSSDRAKKLGASFPNVNRNKAIIHTWLAWQKSPGLPYGSAVRARFFNHDSSAAIDFVAWFRNVFGIG